MENTENKQTTLDKVKNFLHKRKMEFALFVAMIATCMFTGIGFGTILGVSIFLWATAAVSELPKIGRTLSFLMRLVVFVVLIYSWTVPSLHRFSEHTDVGWDNLDMGLTSLLGDRTETKARDIWKIKKDKKGKEFLAYYNFLLSQERTVEARDTLRGFLKAWDLDRKEQRVSNRDPAQVQSQSQLAPSTSGTVNSTVLYPGTHRFALKAGQETPKFSFPDCGYYPYSVSSPSYDYEIVYSPRERYHGDPDLKIPERNNPSFSIVAGRTETITIVVSKS